MANIMITECCNLHCPYCFANEFVHKESNYISIDDFHEAVAFIKTAQQFDGRVGLIGGEPTIAPNFGEILQILNKDDAITTVPIYTNGLLIDEYISVLKEKKFDFLINLNSQEDIGEENYEHIQKNIQLLIENGKRMNLALGINIYKENQNVEYFMETLKRFQIHHARIAITTPNNGEKHLGFEHLKQLRGKLLDLTMDLMYEKIHFIIDCNRPPQCVWDDIEQWKLQMMHHKLLNKKQYRNMFVSKCNPVIDILPNLTAIRCFGLSNISKVPIKNFKSIDDLSNYYIEEIDNCLLEQITTQQCNDCYAFKNKECYGGCLSNKGCF